MTTCVDRHIRMLVHIAQGTNDKPKQDRNWYQEWGGDMTDLTILFERGLWKEFEIWG